MKIVHTIHEMQKVAEEIRHLKKRIGFVPTMGYLHEGHLSLLEIARKKADEVVVSIYVNPAQFDPNEDLSAYPRDFKRDEALLKESGTDILFYPNDIEMYGEGYQTWITVENLTRGLCGASRPTHFRGVTTICMKLFHAVKPHFAVFGQKDYQQVRVIRQMVDDLNLDLDIIVGPIIRETDGLAMSSRNQYLSVEERKSARVLFQSLELAEERVRRGEKETQPIIHAMKDLIENTAHTRVDYIEIVDSHTLEPIDRIENQALAALAIFIGSTRLIDNRNLRI
jgi:pantoate--beta-alanine ligase